MTPSKFDLYDFCRSARDAHNEFTLGDYPSFDSLFNTCLAYHYIFKGPDYFLLGGRDASRDDAWLVWWAEFHPQARQSRIQSVRKFLDLMPYDLPYVGWARVMKGRYVTTYYSTARLRALTQ